MDGTNSHFTVRTFFSFLLLILLQTSTEAQELCSAPDFEFAENNTVNDVVVNITIQSGVSLGFAPNGNPDNLFRLEGNQLIAAKVLDREKADVHVVSITCTASESREEELVLAVIVTDVNDNPPNFNMNPYHLDISEIYPIDTSVTSYPATDLDEGQLYYTLTSEPQNVFKLLSPTVPELLLQTPLEYDKVKNITLVLKAQDTPLDSTNPGPSFTATTTIMVNVMDADNRPPWFQPCKEYDVKGVRICQSSGYTGTVFLNEQETGALPLKPGPLHAIDGDSGINDEIIYSFVGGNGSGLFDINPNTGNITMLKPADVLEPITLTVLAAQKHNRFQYATTTVTINVEVKGDHPPRFQRSLYQGVVARVGNMAMDRTNEDTLLQILATDGDFNATGGMNPRITYRIEGSNDFLIYNGYLFMTKALPDGTLTLQVVATDTTNDQSDTAELVVEVKSGLTTTSAPQSTTDSTATTSTGGSTSNPSTSTDSSISTTIPSTNTDSSMPTGGGGSTTKPSPTSESIISTTKPSIPTGGSGSTTKPSPTGGSGSTTKPSPTSESIISTTKPSIPTGGSGSTTKPSPTGGSGSTTKPSPTSEGSITTANTAHPHTGLTTTSTPSTGETTTNSKTTKDIVTTNKPNPGTPPEGGVSTAKPSPTGESIITTPYSSTPPEGGVSTAKPSPTGDGGITTASTAPPCTGLTTTSAPSTGETTTNKPNPGGYGPGDMAALGATLGVLLFICLVIIAVLVFRIRRGDADWRKIKETTVFRSSLGQGSGGQKKGISYTNDAFENDEDGVSTGSGGKEGKNVTAAGEPQKASEDIPLSEATAKSSVALYALLDDNTSQAGSDQADSEKEVKPILTKERRVDEGYKSVWFKEDIDPDAKEEVVIIPDSRENDSDEEDEERPSSSREEDQDDNPLIKAPRVVFNDSDLDSGLGVKMEDQAEDSEYDQVSNL